MSLQPFVANGSKRCTMKDIDHAGAAQLNHYEGATKSTCLHNFKKIISEERRQFLELSQPITHMRSQRGPVCPFSL